MFLIVHLFFSLGKPEHLAEGAPARDAAQTKHEILGGIVNEDC
jgi:hypothetical protein